MTTIKTLAAATLALGLLAAPVFAAEANVDTQATGSVSTGAPGDSPSSSLNLGIDISGAGTTIESRTAFFKGLSEADQKMVTDRCADPNAATPMTAEEKEFCKVATR